MKYDSPKVFKLLYILTWVCFIVSVILQIQVYNAPKEKPIVPVNPVAKKAEPVKPFKMDTSSKKDTAKDDKPADTLSVVLKANKRAMDDFENEEIKVYDVDKPISDKTVKIIVSDLAIAKLTEDTMAELKEKGSGLVDVTISVENTGTEPVKIPLDSIKLTANTKEYPLRKTDTKEEVIQKDELKDIALSIIIPTEKELEEIERLSFPVKTVQGKQEMTYEVVIILK